MKSQNGDNHSEQSTAERFNCRRCDETFDSKKNLKRHLISNHATKIECNVCDEIFSKNYDLEVHIKTAHKPKELHNCDTCGK